MRTLSDESLLAGLGSGDPAAASAFIARYQRRVYGLTLSILRDAGAAEEAAQETFVRAWTHAEAFDPRRGSVPGWLLTIARNVAINMLPTRRPDPVDPSVLLSLQGQGPPMSDAQSQPVPSRCAMRSFGCPNHNAGSSSWPFSTDSRPRRSASSTMFRSER